MTINEFKDLMHEEVGNRLGEEYIFRASDVTKNNGIVHTGISFAKKGANVCPTVYLESFYEEMRKGKRIECIADELADLFSADTPSFEPDPNDFDDYSKIKDRIYCKVVNYSMNSEIIKDCPCVKVLDLCVLFYVLVEYSKDGSGSILIKNELFDMWKVSKSELYDTALKNTERMFEVRLFNINEVLMELLSERYVPGSAIYESAMEDLKASSQAPMYVLTNRDRFYGATGILYTQKLSEFAKEMDTDLYIIPCSIHELILVPAYDEADPSYLIDMVREVNATEVRPSEVLSDNIYIFKRQDKCVSGIYSA